MFGPYTPYVRPYRLRMLLGVLAIAIAQAASTYIPVLLGAAVDSIEAIDAPSHDLLLGGIRIYVLQIVGLGAVVALGGYTMRNLLGGASTGIEYDIRVRYFTHLLRLPLSYYQTHRTGDLMARATNDLTQVRIFFTYGLRGIVESSLILIFSAALMCRIDWRLTLIVALPLPLLSLFIVRMAALVHSRFKAIQEFFGQMSNFIQENLSGIRVIKAYVQSGSQNATFDDLNETYLDRNHHLIRTRAIYRPLSFLIASLGLGLNLWFGGSRVIAGSLSIGDFVAFNAYLTLLIRPISYMGWVIDRFQRALVAMRRINEVLDAEPAIADLPARREVQPITGHIQFQNLDFSYDGGPPVLQQIDLEIPAGTTLGIIGRVGSGKTTLARLIPRLIQTGEGQLLIDGRPVEEWPLETLRQAIGYVSQNPFLFSNTIRANIGYGVENPTGEQIAAAAEQAQIRADIEGFDGGFDTVIGERGVTLSGGQKQRSTLARAIIRQPAILILDDALSAVDTHTEEAILGYLRQIMKDRTTILIAHRISTLRDADHIVVLDEGRIVEQGNHQQLVELDGIYADLFRRQQLAAELEAL